MSYPKYGLTFNKFSETNATRCVEGFGHTLDDDGWLSEQWMNAALGELGEAANLVKKRTRLQLAADHEVTDHMIAIELADAVTYIDLLCTKLGYNLGDVIAEKFNIVSERVGASQTLTNRVNLTRKELAHLERG